LERRRRLILILPEVEEELKRRRTDLGLTGSEIREIDLALQSVERFRIKLETCETTNNCLLGRIIGSTAVGTMYYKLTGRRDLESFLESDYQEVVEAFGTQGMKVPIVLEEIHTRYWRFDAPADGIRDTPPDACTSTDC
jgi:hypothetical protein